MVPLSLMENAKTSSQTRLVANVDVAARCFRVRTDLVCFVDCEMSQLTQTRRSPLLVWMKDVVLRLHRHMACVPAIGCSRVGYKLVGRGVIVEQGISPAARVRKPLAVLL